MLSIRRALTIAGVFFCAVLFSASAFADATVVGVQLVNSVRTGRTAFDYTYRLRVQNGATPLRNVRAVATSSNPATVLVKNTVTIGDLAANASVTTADTFTIRQNRAVPYDAGAITWQVLFDRVGATVAEVLAALEASGQIPKLDRSATIAGPDANGNGVRDDIDSYINALPDAAPQKSALRQIAKAVGAAMLAGGANVTEPELRQISALIGKAVKCIWERYDATTASDKVAAIEKLMANTRARYDAYDQYNTKVSGRSSRLPRGVVCDAA